MVIGGAVRQEAALGWGGQEALFAMVRGQVPALEFGHFPSDIPKGLQMRIRSRPAKRSQKPCQDGSEGDAHDEMPTNPFSVNGPARNRALLILAAALLSASVLHAAEEAPPFPVAIRVDAAKAKGELKPIWRFFGADEPNYAYMKDGKKLLTELGRLGPQTAYFRPHSLLVSGDGTPALKWGSTGAYREDAQGRPSYDWTIVDRMFGQMSGQRLAVESTGGLTVDAMKKSGVRTQPDVSALASLDKNKLCVLTWHYHDDDLPGPAAAVELSFAGLPVNQGAARLRHYRIDAEHSNAFEAWKKIGSPAQPSPEQYTQLENAGQLATLGGPDSVSVKDGEATLRVVLPRQGVSLIVLEWP